jgi:hypothetical protein
MEGDMSGLKNRPNLNRERVATIRAFAEAGVGLSKVIMSAANGVATRVDRAGGLQDSFQMCEGCGFVMKLRLRNA